MWKAELAADLRRHGPSVLPSYMERTGKSRGQLYRIAGQHGYTSGRKSRSDKGALRSGLTDSQVEYVAALVHVTRRENKGPILPVEDALEVAFDNGVIERGQVSPATMSRILRERSLSKRHMKAPTPHTEMRSLHPNHCHVFDVSVCIQYYLKGGRMGVMDERDFYKNKPQNFAKVKTRLMRYVLVDHFSGAYYFRYYAAAGETQNNLYDFLLRAWGRKGDARLPIRGVPFLLLMDRGAANTSKAIIELLRRMDVGVPEGMPYNPRKQGAVEGLHNILERSFETKLRIQPATGTDELNAWAEDFMAFHQGTKKHTRHGMTRTECWLRITSDQLRELPDAAVLQDLYAEPERECTVRGDYSISFRGEEYRLKHVEGLFRGAKVQAVLKPWTWPVIDVRFRGAVYEAAPRERLSAEQGGFSASAAVIGREHKAQPETLTQQAEKRMENIAYGEEGLDERGVPRRGAVPFRGTRVFGIHADKLGDIAYMPRQGEPLQVDRAVANRRIPIMELLKRLRAEKGTVSKELNAGLRARYGGSVSTHEAEEIIKAVKAGRWPELLEGGGAESPDVWRVAL